MLESKARTVSEQLAGEFLRNGNFEAAKAAMDVSTVASMLPATAGLETPHLPEHGFAGLSIQSIGYTLGAEEEVVQIYVTRGGKRSLDRLATDISGVKVRVTNLGRLVIRPEAIAATGIRGSVYEHNGRIACGSSCAPAGENYSGTFGALVYSEGKLLALSNNHVFAACNHVPVGQPILSPSAMDARPEIPAPRQLCRHARIVELRSGTPTLVPLARCDAAVASIPDETTVSSWQGDDSTGFDTPVLTTAPISGLRVKKVGRTTNLTLGTVEALIPAPMPLPYKNTNFTASVWFADIWTVKADEGEQFALPGDSGSLVVTESGDAAVGLLFASSARGDYAWIAPIDTVLSDLSLTLVGNHGV